MLFFCYVYNKCFSVLISSRAPRNPVPNRDAQKTAATKHARSAPSLWKCITASFEPILGTRDCFAIQSKCHKSKAGPSVTTDDQPRKLGEVKV